MKQTTAMMDPELESQLVKDGQIQREKIDDDVEKFLEAAQKGYYFLLPLPPLP